MKRWMIMLSFNEWLLKATYMFFQVQGKGKSIGLNKGLFFSLGKNEYGMKRNK